MADFVFTRLQYDSGDWDVDPRMPSNLLHSLLQYTTLEVEPEERIVALRDPAMLRAPFCYLSGHRLVELGRQEAENFRRYVENGGFVFVDDCNHDIDGLFARSFEEQMARIFGSQALVKIGDDHQIYDAFFRFEGGPPTSSFELNDQLSLFYEEQAKDFLWWSAAVWLIGILDAWVDAHLYDVRAYTPETPAAPDPGRIDGAGMRLGVGERGGDRYLTFTFGF